MKLDTTFKHGEAVDCVHKILFTDELLNMTDFSLLYINIFGEYT